MPVGGGMVGNRLLSIKIDLLRFPRTGDLDVPRLVGWTVSDIPHPTPGDLSGLRPSGLIARDSKSSYEPCLSTVLKPVGLTPYIHRRGMM